MEATDDISQYGELLHIRFDNENVRNAVEAKFHGGRHIILNAYENRNYGVAIGETIWLSTSDASHEYTVIGSFKSRVSGVNALIPAQYAVTDFNLNAYGLVLFQAENPDAAATEIRTLFGTKENWTRTVSEFNADALGVVGAFLAPLNYLTYFVLLLCIIGVINNLLIQYIQKKRSIAMYKSVGLSKAQLIKMTLIEGFSSGSIGGLIGCSIAWLEIKTIFLVAGPHIPIELDLAPSLFILAGLIGIVVTLVGSIAPILKGTTMQIVEEIRFE
jgi:ABC-type antimicrobial peptide transport system permease subunit